jgi:hypothetical protein
MIATRVSILLLCAFILGSCKRQPQEISSQYVIFPPKAFFNGLHSSGQPDIVYIAGALTGSNVGYPNNYTAITCYQDRKECVVTAVDQIGDNQIGRVDMPYFFPVTKWDEDTIVANGQTDIGNCRRLTITIVRATESALWVEAPVNSSDPDCKKTDRGLLNWTIENPPSWKALRGTTASRPP